MWTTTVVMDREFFQDHPEVTLVDWDQEVKALTPYASHEPFAECIRRRRSDRSFQGPHSEPLQRLIHAWRKDAVPVMNQESVGMVERKELAELLDGPFGGRMCSYVRVKDPPGTNLHRHEDVQHSERGGH